MGQEIKAHKMEVGEFKWKSSLGRPRCILWDNIEVDLTEISSDYVKQNELGQERIQRWVL